MQALKYSHPDQSSLINGMARYGAMLDTLRDGLVKPQRAVIPDDEQERARHLKSFGYFQDASMMGICKISPDMLLTSAIDNPDIDALAHELKTRQTSTLASGIDLIMADLKTAMEQPPKSVKHHTHALVFLYQFPRDPKHDEAGTRWITDCQSQRACLRAAETSTVLANYIRLLGFEARGHSGSACDYDLNKLAVMAGLAYVDKHQQSLVNPYLGTRFGVGAVTTTLSLASDLPLSVASAKHQSKHHGLSWWLGIGTEKSLYNNTPFAKRQFKDGEYAFETIKRVDDPTTFIDEARVPRVPKRADMFARAIFGDMGPKLQNAAKNGDYVRKSPASYAHRSSLGAFVLLQDQQTKSTISSEALDPKSNTESIKAALYFLGADAVGVSRCPDWVYYSHNAAGEPITPYHQNAISVIIDQGHETMEGASGDDWIACAQSMRAYLRFSLLGGIVADQIRALGYNARVHSVMDGEVLQPPLLLLAGLGEVSRIGEVILNPFLGPRLKSGVITTDMPLEHDKPIDFGLQNFCNACNKCARECPSGAITAGNKVMFNGYEIWKSDSQKCTTYRVSHLGGAMCGRCMKTCPWNLEGLFAEAPFRWLASNVPTAAKSLAKLDDKLGNGRINHTKKWWWDLEMVNNGPYQPPREKPHERDIQPDLDIVPSEQTLAVYPAHLAPHPYPYPYPMDREAGIKAYSQLLNVDDYKKTWTGNAADSSAQSHTNGNSNRDKDAAPVLALKIALVEKMTERVNKYELVSHDGSPLPAFEAGAHIDIVVAPEYLRQYSLSGNPSQSNRYQIAVLREDQGLGGSALLHKIFIEGRRIFASPPINHFALIENADHVCLFAGGIGITPLIAMSHRLHSLGRSFELHYSCASKAEAAFLNDLEAMPWRDKLHWHFSAEGSRLNLSKALQNFQAGNHLYTCGPDNYMTAVVDTATGKGWPEDAIHTEYFTPPETPNYINHSFRVRLAKSNKIVHVDADQSAAEALLEAGVNLHIKCSDGLCGTCKCTLLEGEVEHRDFVLSNAQRSTNMITCQSRAQQPDAEISLDL